MVEIGMEISFLLNFNMLFNLIKNKIIVIDNISSKLPNKAQLL